MTRFGSLQARPETVWSARKSKRRKSQHMDAGNRDIIVKVCQHPLGNAAGKAHVIINPEDIDEFEGESLSPAI
ncbi:MAG: hypothetical protein ACLUPK_08215 [Veillonella sp.]